MTGTMGLLVFMHGLAFFIILENAHSMSRSVEQLKRKRKEDRNKNNETIQVSFNRVPARTDNPAEIGCGNSGGQKMKENSKDGKICKVA